MRRRVRRPARSPRSTAGRQRPMRRPIASRTRSPGATWPRPSNARCPTPSRAWAAAASRRARCRRSRSAPDARPTTCSRSRRAHRSCRCWRSTAATAPLPRRRPAPRWTARTRPEAAHAPGVCRLVGCPLRPLLAQAHAREVDARAAQTTTVRDRTAWKTSTIASASAPGWSAPEFAAAVRRSGIRSEGSGARSVDRRRIRRSTGRRPGSPPYCDGYRGRCAGPAAAGAARPPCGAVRSTARRGAVLAVLRLVPRRLRRRRGDDARIEQQHRHRDDRLEQGERDDQVEAPVDGHPFRRRQHDRDHQQERQHRQHRDQRGRGPSASAAARRLRSIRRRSPRRHRDPAASA